jgi:hypothetical protein
MRRTRKKTRPGLLVGRAPNEEGYNRRYGMLTCSPPALVDKAIMTSGDTP